MRQSALRTPTSRAAADPSIVATARALGGEVGVMKFGAPAAYVYNPLEYAWAPHEAYLRRCGAAPIETLFVGMNPGPFGMVQTGVPFGEVTMVREFLGIEAPVRRPAHEHPKRPVLGFDCPRSEVSGRRVWSWARDRFGTPQAFFERCFIWNWCPLAFVGETGANVTPDKLSARDRAPLEARCDAALRAVIAALRPRYAIGFGRFATDCIHRALEDTESVIDATIGTVLHPSPASPAANRGWAAAVDRQLDQIGWRPLTDSAAVSARSGRRRS